MNRVIARFKLYQDNKILLKYLSIKNNKHAHLDLGNNKTVYKTSEL